MDTKDLKDKLDEGVKGAKEKFDETFTKENLEAGKEKLKAGTAKANEKIKGLPFRRIAEEKIPAQTRAKFPILDKLIPFTNQIVCGLAAVLLVVVAVNVVGGGGKGGSSRGGGVSSGDINAAIRAMGATGKNYVLNKPTDFSYELTKIDGQDYVIIKGVNRPDGYEGPIEVDRPEGGYQWQIRDTMTINVPEKIEGYTVGAIGDRAFSNTRSHVAVTLPDTVIEIGSGAFGQSSITSFRFPRNLKRIGTFAFYQSNLSGSITIPAGVTEIQSGVFDGTKITEVILHDGVTIIGGNAFWGCSELTNVKLPSGPVQYLRQYGEATFSDPQWYEPETKGDNSAFFMCPKLSLATRSAIQASGYTGNF